MPDFPSQVDQYKCPLCGNSEPDKLSAHLHDAHRMDWFDMLRFLNDVLNKGEKILTLSAAKRNPELLDRAIRDYQVIMLMLEAGDATL